MKVKSLLVAAMATVLCLGASNASAIEAPNHEGDFNLNAHIGFVPGIGANVSGDYVLVNSWWKGHFTVGGFVGFNRDSDRPYWGSPWKFVYSNLSIMPRATYGLNILDNFEVHAGAGVGPCFRNWKYKYDDGYVKSSDDIDKDHDVQIDYLVVAGCRYFLTESFALSAEINASDYMSYINLGVSFKF